MATLELYGSARCPYTQELREWLEWTRRDFREYDVDADPEARARMNALGSSVRTVPVLVEDGKVIQVGWQGRGCIVASTLSPSACCALASTAIFAGSPTGLDIKIRQASFTSSSTYRRQIEMLERLVMPSETDASQRQSPANASRVRSDLCRASESRYPSDRDGRAPRPPGGR